MKPTRILSVLAVAAISLLCSCKSSDTAFVKVKDGRFFCEDYPSHYIGTNFWYGAILASVGEGGNIERLETELDDLKALGINNLRILVGGDGPNGVPTRIEPTLQKEPGVYNDTIFRGLDRLLVEMAERNMKAVLYINNSWEWSGGYGMYLEWAGEGKALVPAVDGWPQYQEHVSKFVTSDKAKQLYADHVKHVVTRVNTITGKPYSEDPAIFSWQIGNEPRCFRSDAEGQQAFVDWLWSSAALIKSLDPNHMVSVGSEGKWGCEGSMELYDRIHSCPDIDYLTIHIWPYNWKWVEENTLKTNLPVAIRKTDEYIDEHLVVAEKYCKPMVLEEFGFPRDDFKFSKSSTTNARNDYYEHVFNRVVESAKTGGLFAGVNYWGWGGHASQSETNIYWKKGDDYCGDPAQEQQGLNSVYIEDGWTNLITLYAARNLEKALLPQVELDALNEGNGIFDVEGKHTLNFTARFIDDLKAELEFVVETEFGEPVTTVARKVDFIAGKEVPISFDIEMTPGFYKVITTLVEKDGTRTEIAARFIGCCPEKIQSPQDKQPDFDEFWENNLKELAAVKPEYKLTLLKDKSNDVRRTYRVDMKSLGGEAISGIYVEPVAPGKYPVMIYYMGYDTQVWDIDPSANPEMSEFILCIRKQALNKKGKEAGWVKEGIESKDTYYYRGAICDAVRAIDFVCSREKTDPARVFAQGESQGGALTFAAAALDDRFRAVAPSAPFLCDFPDYMRLAQWPSNEINEAAQEKGMSQEDLLKVLSYFDMKNLADRIICPLIMGVGLQDDVCPVHTNFAGFNMVPSEKSWICYPKSKHNVWEQPEWPEAKEEFFRLYR